MDNLRPDYINIRANDFEDVENLGFDLYQEKIDGHWVAITISRDGWKMQKRTGRVAAKGRFRVSGAVSEKALWNRFLQEMHDAYFTGTAAGDHTPRNAILIGELVGDRVHLFDCALLQDGRAIISEHMPYLKRQHTLSRVPPTFVGRKHLGTFELKVLPVFRVFTGCDVDERHAAAAFKRLLEEGGEGFVFRRGRSIDFYHPIGRMKRFTDIDLKISGLNLKPDGSFKSLRLVGDDGEPVCSVRSGLDKDLIDQLLRGFDGFKGRTVRVVGQEITRHGKLRHPVFIGFHNQK